MSVEIVIIDAAFILFRDISMLFHGEIVMEKYRTFLFLLMVEWVVGIGGDGREEKGRIKVFHFLITSGKGYLGL